MTPEQTEAVANYFKYVLGNLELADWRFVISEAPPDDDNTYAEIWPTDGRKLAVLKLCNGFCDMPATQIRHILIHEALHLIHRDVTDPIRLILPNVLGQQSYNILWESIRMPFEIMVDTLAYAFEDYFKEYPNENKALYAIRGELPPPRLTPGIITDCD